MRPSPALARLLYVGVVLFATIAELRADPDPSRAGARLARALHPQLTARDVVDGVRNLLLFAGLGATWAATSAAGRWWRAALPATIAGCLLSVAVEGAQLLSPVRTSSVLDVATNTGGTLAGVLITAAVIGALAGRRGRRSYLGVPAAALGVPYALAALCEGFAPLFRSAPVAGAWGGPGRRFAVALAASRGAVVDPPLLDALLFAPAGALLVAALTEFGAGLGAAALASAAAGAGLSALVEVARGASGQAMTPAAVVVHALAWAAGAAAARWTLGPLTRRLRGRRRVGAWAGAYAALLLVWAWRPFRLDVRAATLAAELTPEHLVPLYALGGRGDLVSVADVATQFLLYFPLGALAAVWPLGRRGVARGVLPALALALVLEAGQLVVADRFVDVTDWLVQCAGALVGHALVRRAGFGPLGVLGGGGGAAVAAGARARNQPSPRGV